MFEKEWNKIAKEIYKNAVNHGFWKGEVNDGERMALIHAEISEALEALREGNPSSNKIMEFTNLEEELADAVIRIMDYAFGIWSVPDGEFGWKGLLGFIYDWIS